MLKKGLCFAMILMLALSMLGGCKSVSDEQESAAADSYIEGQDQNPSGGTIIIEQEEQGSSDQQNHQKPAEDKQESSEDEEQTPSGNQGSSDDKEEQPEQGGDEEQNDQNDQEDQNDQNDQDENNQPSGEEDPFADTPISKTEATTADGVKYYKENAIEVVSYNIRCANDPDGHSVAERKPRLKKVLEDYDADLMGFQEVTLEWELNLLEMLGDEYDSIVEYRNNGSGAEANPIFYRKSQFKLLDSGTFWLSDTPEEESKGWGADHYRICTWVKLQVRKTGAVFHYFNTHVDYKPDPQVPSAELLIKRAKSMAGSGGVILTGDFNLTSAAPAYQTLTTYWANTNMLTVKDTTQGTLPNYGKNKNGGNIIDFCFVTPKAIKATSYKVMTDMVGGKYVSDHFGIYSKMIIL
ncbi:MAG: endonuclease/exonuclease/phosphatase family protein [Clostridia bacterium]|nr:endonuclease/exonuclease/phosphatase family protein [Clostridia bacterium]